MREARHRWTNRETFAEIAVIASENQRSRNVAGGAESVFCSGPKLIIQPRADPRGPRWNAAVAIETEGDIVLVIDSVGDMQIQIKRGRPLLEKIEHGLHF